MQCLYMSRNCSRCYNIYLGMQAIRFSKPLMHLCFISHISRMHLTHFNFSLCFKIKLLLLLSHLEWFYTCLVSLRPLYFISYTSRIFQTFTMLFEIKLLPLLSHLEWFYECLVSLLGPYVLSCRQHASRTFQTFTVHFEIKLIPLLSHLKCFYAFLVSLLGPYIESRTYLAHFKLSLWVSKSNYYPSKVI